MNTRQPQEGSQPVPTEDPPKPGKGDGPSTPQRIPDPDGPPGSFLVKGNAAGLGLAAVLGALFGFMLCRSTACTTCR